ncbi:hypothetical protein [Streptomyces sp. NPDC002550]
MVQSITTACCAAARVTFPEQTATLYENANPYLINEPSGALDTGRASYTALDDRTVRVSGAEYHEADTCTIKLEGSRLVGCQTIAMGGIRDRDVIEHLAPWPRPGCEGLLPPACPAGRRPRPRLLWRPAARGADHLPVPAATG